MEEETAATEPKEQEAMEKTPETEPDAEPAPEDDDDAAAAAGPSSTGLPEEEIRKGTLEDQRKQSVDTFEGSLEDPFTSFESTEAAAVLESSTAGLTTTAGPASVTPERKEELLLEARANRIKWIQEVPLPYRKTVANKDDPWNQDENLSNFRSSHAGTHLPTVFAVLSLLYGMQDGATVPNDVTARVESVMESNKEEQNETAFPSGKQTLKEELVATNDDPLLKAYHSFWGQLQEPECATLVQGMRNFCRNLQDLDNSEAVVLKLKAYLVSTRESLKSHVLWKKSGVDEAVQRSLESFVYGQCHSLLRSVLLTDTALAKEKAWMERLESLQFVTPPSLEIACLDAGDFDLDTVLKDPIDALRSVNRYHSAYEKLQRILAVYHGVNAALSEALNRNRNAGNESNKKLPSADDVLPTIILTILRAKPENLHVDLQMVEDFSPPEYLRGEAGYAYTNLYGAVHFLQDMDLEGEPKSLSISPEEFRKGLEACRAITVERLNKFTSITEDLQPLEEESVAFKMIPPQKIRAARRRGEDISLEWAIQWQQQNSNVEIEGLAEDQGNDRAVIDGVTEQLPPGFSRNYSFLTSRPEDVRVSDLPQLLSEYRMLVHATETLIGQRAAKASAERKKKTMAAQKDLLAVVKEVDPSLLPSRRRRSKFS